MLPMREIISSLSPVIVGSSQTQALATLLASQGKANLRVEEHLCFLPHLKWIFVYD